MIQGAFWILLNDLYSQITSSELSSQLGFLKILALFNSVLLFGWYDTDSKNLTHLSRDNFSLIVLDFLSGHTILCSRYFIPLFRYLCVCLLAYCKIIGCDSCIFKMPSQLLAQCLVFVPLLSINLAPVICQA